MRGPAACCQKRLAGQRCSLLMAMACAGTAGSQSEPTPDRYAAVAVPAAAMVANEHGMHITSAKCGKPIPMFAVSGPAACPSPTASA